MTTAVAAVGVPLFLQYCASAATTVAYLDGPQQIADPATLAPGTVNQVVFTARDNSGQPVPGATVSVALVRTDGGGSAMVGGAALGSRPRAVAADGSGVIRVAYRTPSALPRGGRDRLIVTAGPSAAAAVFSEYAFTTVDHFVWFPDPLAGPGSLPPSTSVQGSLAAMDDSGRPVSGAQTCLRIASVGGRLSVGATPITSRYHCFSTDSRGRLAFTYRTPARLPATGDDMLFAQDSIASPVSQSRHGYSFGAPQVLRLTPETLARHGSLAPGDQATVTVTPLDRFGNPVGGTQVYVWLEEASGATAVVNNAVNAADGTLLNSSPQAFVGHTNTRLTVTYRATQPSIPGVTDRIVVRLGLSPGAATAVASYEYGGTAPGAGPLVSGVRWSTAAPLTDGHLAVTPVLSPAAGQGVALVYRWERDTGTGFADIHGAQGPTLDLAQPGNGDKGDRIRVLISPRRGSTVYPPYVSGAVTVADSPPVAVPDVASTRPGATVVVDVTRNDTDPDQDQLTVTRAQLLTSGAGTVTVAARTATGGQVRYTPTRGFTGPAIVSYVVSDGTRTAIGRLTVSVEVPVPCRPLDGSGSGTRHQTSAVSETRAIVRSRYRTT